MHASAVKESMNHKERVKHHLADGARRIRKDADDTTDQVYGDLNSMARTIGEQMREFVENAGEGIVHAKDSISDATDATAAQIRKKPVMFMAAAVGVGILLGAFLRR